jgi:hypothetical protein
VPTVLWQANARSNELVPRTATEFALSPVDGRLQSVKHAALTPTAVSKNLHNLD